MKRKSILINISVIILILVAGTVKLISNKRYFSEQLKMVSEAHIIVPVITDTARLKVISAEFVENGTFYAFRELTVISETQGRVIDVLAKTGDYVSAGQVMGFTDNKALKSQLELAEYSLLKAEKDLHRFEELSKDEAVTLQQSESARQNYLLSRSAFVNAETQYKNSFLTAPFNGFVSKRHIEKGSFIIPGTPLFDIVETERLKLILKLTGEQVTQIYRGMNVNVSAGPYAGIDYQGKVSAIETNADFSKRYATEIEVPNSTANPILPGMFGSGTFRPKSDKKQLVIPRRAITGSIQYPEVFVVSADSVILKSIEAVPVNDRLVSVKTGLTEGDVIVVSGQINLVNGSKISIIH